jgi:hypothetical protein
MEINYETNRLYIGTYGRGIWYSPLAENGTDKTITIRKNTIWDSRKRLDGKLVIQPGKTLTIKEDFFISTHAEIILKKKSALIVQQKGRKTHLKSFDGKDYDITRIKRGKNSKLEIKTQ